MRPAAGRHAARRRPVLTAGAEGGRSDMLYRKMTGGMLHGYVGAIFLVVGFPFFLMGLTMRLNWESFMAFAETNGSGDVWILPFAFMFTGGLLTVIGAGLLAYCIKNVRRRKRLMMHGHCLTAQVIRVEPDWTRRYNGRATFRLECEYAGNGDSVLFYSEPLTMDPSGYLISDRVPVYVRDYGAYDDYYVDASAVLPIGFRG